MIALVTRRRRLCSLLGVALLTALLAIAPACRPAAVATATPTATRARPTPSPTPRPVATITPAQVRALSAAAQIAIFDARSREEYAAGHLPGAISLPLGELPQRVGEVPRDRPVVFYCSGST